MKPDRSALPCRPLPRVALWTAHRGRALILATHLPGLCRRLSETPLNVDLGGASGAPAPFAATATPGGSLAGASPAALAAGGGRLRLRARGAAPAPAAAAPVRCRARSP